MTAGLRERKPLKAVCGAMEALSAVVDLHHLYWGDTQLREVKRSEGLGATVDGEPKLDHA